MTRAATAAARALLALSLAAAAMGAWASEAAAAPDLAVEVVSGPNPVAIDEKWTVTATVRNKGDEPAPGTAISFGQFTDVALLSVGPGCQDVFGLGVLALCQIGTLAPLAAAQGSVTFTGASASNASVVVNVSYDNEGGGTAVDPTPDDNTATATTTVEPRSDLKLLLDVSPPQVTAGNAVAVTATVSNSAAGPARDARILIQMPPELTVLHGGGCAVGALQLTCDLGTVASLTTVERKLQILVPREGTFIVIGTVVSSRPDPTPLDTQAQVSVIGLEPVGAVIPPPPPAPPAPAPKAKAKPKAKVKLKKPVRLKISLLAKGVPRKNCVRSRKLRLRLRQPGGAARSKAQIYVGKRRIKTVRGKALRKSVRLSRLPKKGRYKLLVVLTLRDGGRLSGRRTLRACRSSRR